MYELFILGQLMDHSMTGYSLRKAFIAIAGGDQAISFGTLYPLLDKLEQAQEISLSFKTVDNKRPQKLATITDKGKNHFYELINTTVAINKQTQLTFLMKVNFLHLLNQQQQVFVLEDFQNFSKDKLQHLQRRQTDLRNNKHMVQADIDDVLLVKQLQIARTQTQVDWVSQLLKQRREA